MLVQVIGIFKKQHVVRGGKRAVTKQQRKQTPLLLRQFLIVFSSPSFVYYFKSFQMTGKTGSNTANTCVPIVHI